MLSFLQHATLIPRVCVDAASRISQLMNTYVHIYGADKCFSILPRCLTFAAIVHVLNLDNAKSDIHKMSSEFYLAQAIGTLYDMKSRQCLKVIGDLIHSWGVTIPEAVRISLNEIRLESTIRGLTIVPVPTNDIANSEDWATDTTQEDDFEQTGDARNVLQIPWNEAWTNF